VRVVDVRRVPLLWRTEPDAGELALAMLDPADPMDAAGEEADDKVDPPRDRGEPPLTEAGSGGADRTAGAIPHRLQ
jgi:hypothetical protein